MYQTKTLSRLVEVSRRIVFSLYSKLYVTMYFDAYWSRKSPCLKHEQNELWNSFIIIQRSTKKRASCHIFLEYIMRPTKRVVCETKETETTKSSLAHTPIGNDGERAISEHTSRTQLRECTWGISFFFF